MLQRVSNALSKLLSPISSTESKKPDSEQGGGQPQEFQRFIPKKSEKDKPEKQNSAPPLEKPGLKLVSNQEQQVPVSPSPFFQITTIIQEQGKLMSRWLGIKAYQKGSNKQKKGAKFRKGSIIDRQSD